MNKTIDIKQTNLLGNIGRRGRLKGYNPAVYCRIENVISERDRMGNILFSYMVKLEDFGGVSQKTRHFNVEVL